MSTKFSRGPGAANREARRKRRTHGALAKILTGGMAAGLLLGALAPASGAFAWSSGGGANPGTGGSGGNYATVPYGIAYDELVAGNSGAPVQGVGLASMDYLMAFVNAPQRYPNIQAACTQALANADSRPGATPGQSRVIGIWWSAGASGPFPTNSSYHQSDNYFWQNAWNPWTSGGFAGLYTRATLAGAELAAYDAAVNSALVNTGVTHTWGPTTSAACIALSSNQPEPNYQLTLSTDHSANVPVVAGTQQAVYDTINASRGSSSISENVNATVTLRWSGPESVANAVDASVSKTVSIANNGSTRSPDFTPADFGWHSWPSGKFWFDVDVTKQGKMKDPASHAGVNDARENWTTLRDEDVVKYLTSGDPADPVADQEVFASGMLYNAVITAPTNGYSSSLTIKDTILTDKVFIGSRTADVQGAAYMLDPEGNRVNGAQISIDRSAAGTVIVSGTVTNIPAAFQSRDYTLVVPTYFLPTGADYTVEDDSSVCYTGDVDECIDGNSESVRKVTPAPDKVWVLDETGALTAADPGHTNQEGTDGKVFLMNDEVAAVVNGRIPANLAEPFSNYEIIDDWTNSAQYVDFSDASKAKVFIETAPGSGQYTNVSSDFDITVNGSVTTAKAKAGSQFLAQSKNSSSVDRKVKLVISGAFKDDYDTNGELVQLTNAGHEVWNNETVDTNVPPVFTWTPDPNKQVLGSSDESGDKTYEDIDGLSVFPGQKLEYSVGVDLRVPKNTARGVKSLSVLDTYDPMFAPDKTSIEFWDSRDPRNPKPVPAKNYKLTFDEATNSFRADFTQEWIDANVNVNGANSEWQTKGWLTMRFTGTVKNTAPGGSTVKNQAFQIINGASTATEIPEVKIPEIKPDKEDLNVHTLENIDGKTVVQGDHLLYRLTLDARVSADELAYNVHKLGMVDDYDEEYLDLTEAGITVKNKATGADVTDKFNIQVKDGKAYVFAKQVDSVNYYGEEIKGDPQPEDLEAYSKAAIDPHKTPIIDQSLLGHEYYVLLDAVVSKETDGYVIRNQATQNIQNTWHETKIVSNPLKDIDPDKDVVVSEETKGDSINGSEIKLYSDFNYRLNSSEIPADRAYAASQWQLKDTFDRVHDEFTGIWAIYANTDVYEGNTLVYKKGDLLQDSAGHETQPRDGLFDVKFDGESYTLTVDATQKYLDLVNTRMDLANSFSVYTKMIRIAPGEKIDNQVLETYNEVERESNIVWTSTPDPKGAVTGDPLSSTGAQFGLWAGIALLLLAAGATTAWAVSRKRRAELLTAAGVDEAPLEQ